MATREENLKKINEQLEQMSDEELDKVAGGILPLIPDPDQKNEPENKIIHVTA